jgi:lipopolysaccharide export system permease protein
VEAIVIGNKIDRFILLRLASITLMVLVMLIIIYIIIDFSENSDDFTDRGATLAEIWTDYYLQYIPEIIRLVTPAAVFVATLLVLGKMAQQFEITALKAAGVSLYRISLPFILFAIFCAGSIAWLDANIVPLANQNRIEFERTYLMTRSDRIDRNKIFRQESDNTILVVNYYLPSDSIAYRTQLISFDGDRVTEIIESGRMEWRNATQQWALFSSVIRTFDELGYTKQTLAYKDTTLNILPRDLSRTSSDVYLMTYPEVRDYLASLERIGAANLELPRVQFYGKQAYPMSIIVITILGVAIASVRRSGGTGLVLGIGLGVMFMYLALMKLAEPFGIAGAIDPLHAVLLPHVVFFIIAVIALIRAKK